MHAIADHLFTLPSIHELLHHELRALAPELAGVFGRQGLFVRSHAAAPAELSAPMLGHWVRLHACGGNALSGDLDCQAPALPFGDDSFRVILIQHAGERIVDAPAFRSELGRVLEPGGVVLAVGFHPYSPWSPWLAWQQRRLVDRVRLCSAARWRDEFARESVHAYAVRRIGNVLRSTSGGDAHWRSGDVRRLLAPLRPSYVLLARKQVLGVTPLRVSLVSRERSVRPQLVSGSQRGCA